MEKYYTPQLIEFHTLFEYEVFVESKNEWSKEIFYLNDSHIKLVKYIETDKLPKIRVKYLDREDIDELIDYEKELISFDKDNVYEFNFNKAGMNYRVFHTSNDKMISFYEVLDDDKLSCFFRGTIKNKSELQKLLIQLGIK